MTILLSPDHLGYTSQQGEREVQTIPSYVANYDISHFPATELKEIIDSTDGDERLFVATLGLHRFIHKQRSGQLGPNEDPVKLYDSYAGVVEDRREELGLTDHPVAQLGRDPFVKH